MSKDKKIIVVDFKHNVNDTLHLYMPHKNIPIVKMQGSLDHEAPTDLQKSLIEKINKSTEAIDTYAENHLPPIVLSPSFADKVNEIVKQLTLTGRIGTANHIFYKPKAK